MSIRQTLKSFQKKRIKPDKILIFSHDTEDPKIVSSFQRGKKFDWLGLEDLLNSSAYERIEFYSASDELIGVISEDSFEEEEEEEEKFTPDRDGRLLEILTQSQKMVLEENRQSVGDLVTGFTKLADIAMERMTIIENKYLDLMSHFENLAKEHIETKAEIVEIKSEQETSQNDSVVIQIVKKLIDSAPQEMIAGLLGPANVNHE